MVHAKRDVTRTKLENSRIFDRQARTYDAEGWGRFTSPLLQRALGALNLPPGGALLDVGCGTGLLLETMLARKEAKVAGIDISPEMIRVAAERLGTQAELRVGDSEDLPWENDTFDAVTCTSSFHHYPQPAKALREMNRVLKRGGQLVLADFWLPAPLRQLVNTLVFPFTKEGDIRIYSKAEILSMLAESGFTSAIWRRVGVFTYIAEAKAG